MKFSPKTLLLFAGILVLTYCGCNPRMSVLNGKYESNTLEILSDRPVDTLWSSITRLFTENNLTVKKVDKERGLILSQATAFIPIYTFEDTVGNLIVPQAWVVLKKISLKKKEWVPKKILGEWHIQISEMGNSTRKIAIDPIVNCTYYPNLITSVETRGQSTGALERLIKRSMGKPANE